jgi:hypothetical protein
MRPIRRPRARKLRQASLAIYLLALPVHWEFATNETAPDSSSAPPAGHSFDLGLHGGRGRVFSVMRDCNGHPTSSVGADLTDWSAEAVATLPIGERTEAVLGLRYDELRTEATTGSRGRIWDPVLYHWWTPSVAVERPSIGLGIGAVIGTVPNEFGDPTASDTFPCSFHLRLGRRDRAFFRIAYLEATPAMSGGGPIQVGVGYRMAGFGSGFTGLSAGYFDSEAFCQQVAIRLGDRWRFDIAGRWAMGSQYPEHTISVGLRHVLPLGD